MKKILLFLFTTTMCLSQNNTTVLNYTETTEIFANPERGFQKYSEAKASNYQLLNQQQLINWRLNEKYTVLYRYFYLDTFINSDISQTYLNNMQTDFNRVRNAGLKIIIRFAYTASQNANPRDATKTRILSHIQQIAPLLELNKDIIVLHQAGFIGVWGEWYYTSQTAEFGNEGSISANQYANRKQITDALLSVTPEEIPLQLRYLDAKKKMYGNDYVGRIGFYNDAFLNVWGDMGTFSVNCQSCTPSNQESQYLQSQTALLPMTGETNGVNPPRTNCTNAIFEMDLYNWSILNRDYFTQNFTNWISSGCYDEINRRLGYRFFIKKATFNTNSTTNLTVNLQIRNSGFAAPFKKRDVFLILKNQTTNENFSFLFDTDCRTWVNEFEISNVINTSSLSPGVYKTYLWLPDSNLLNREEYAIRFANLNIWENGYNNLGYEFEINSLGLQTKISHLSTVFDTYDVYDVLGKYLGNKNVLQNLSGIYFIVASLDDKIYTFKIVK